MADSVTLRLDGSVTIGVLAKATGTFAQLLDQIAKDRSALNRVDWVVSDLAVGSALLTASPAPRSDADADLVPELVNDFIQVAREALTHPNDRSRPVLRLVHSVAESALDHEHSIVFETADDEVVFATEERTAEPRLPAVPALGTIRGRVESLHHRRSLRFVLYDLAHDKPVTCYLNAEQHDQMRDVWGQLVEVTGIVTRDHASDRPRSIRQVSDVRLIPDGDAFGFRRARGAVRVVPNTPASEVLIRRVRDAV